MLVDELKLTPVERVRSLSKGDFEAKYLARGTPVVIEGAVASWPAVHKWSLEYFLERCGDRAVTLRHIYPATGAISTKPSSIHQYLESIRDGRHGAEYVAEEQMSTRLPELVDDLRESPFRRTPPGELRVMFGADSYAPAHFHADEEAISSQIVGRRRFVLFGPDQSIHLYPRPWWNRYMFNFSRANFKTGSLHEFPDVANATGFETILEPGDSIYIPVHYWHTVFALDGFSVLLADFFPAALRRFRYPYPGIPALAGYVRDRLSGALASRRA